MKLFNVDYDKPIYQNFKKNEVLRPASVGWYYICIVVCLIYLLMVMVTPVNATDYSPYEILGGGSSTTGGISQLTTWFPQNITEGTLTITGRNITDSGASIAGIYDYGVGSRTCIAHAYNANAPINYSFDVDVTYTTSARNTYASNFTLQYVIHNLQTFNLTRAMGYGNFNLQGGGAGCLDPAFNMQTDTVIIPPSKTSVYPEDYGRFWAGTQFYRLKGYYGGAPTLYYANLTINVKTNNSYLTPINYTHIYYGSSEGYTNINGNVTFSNISIGTSNIRAYKWGYNDYTESYALTGDSFKQIYLTEGFATPVCGINSYNVIAGDSGSDITSQVDVYEYYNGTWYSDSPPYLPLSFSHNFTYSASNLFMNNKPSLSRIRCDGSDANGTIYFQKSGYMDYTINGLSEASLNYVVMVPNSVLPSVGKCSKVFTTGELDNVNIIIRRSEVGLMEIITATNHLAQSINNNVGNYSFSAYNPTTGKLYNNGSFKCEIGTNVTGKTLDGVHREFIYDADLYIPITAPALPSRNVYVELSDSNTGANILPYDIAIKDDLGVWYNFTVNMNLGKLTPHAYISDDRLITIYANSNGYAESTKTVMLSGYGLDYNSDHVIKMSVSKPSGNFAYTWWQIGVHDSVYWEPIAQSNIGIFDGLSMVYSGTTGANGYFTVNISNNSGKNYDIVATKSGYVTGQINNIIPIGETYVSQIYLVPLVSTPYPTVNGTPLPTPTLFNGGLSTGVCRQALDFNNETFWSPILNIEACVGIVNPVYQQYILAVIVQVLAGILISRKYKSKEGFVTGTVIGNTICAATGLISWSVWVLFIIPMALLFLYKGSGK